MATPARTVNFAIVGTGGVADRALGPALAAAPGARLWSVASRSLERALSFAERHRAAASRAAYSDLDELLADPALDAVIVATPDRLHAEQAMRAARAGKHVLVEKPLAHDVGPAREVVRACREAGVRLGVGYHLRWHEGHRALIERVRRGALGALRHVRAIWTLRAADADNWRAHDEVGRWWSLGRTGTHLVDLARWILVPSEGEVVEVRSVVTRSVLGASHDETALLLLRFASGASAELAASVAFDAPPRVEIYGASAAARCEGTLGPHGGGDVFVGDERLAYVRRDPFVGELGEFVAAIVEGRDPEASGEEGAWNVEILSAACP